MKTRVLYLTDLANCINNAPTVSTVLSTGFHRLHNPPYLTPEPFTVTGAGFQQKIHRVYLEKCYMFSILGD